MKISGIIGSCKSLNEDKFNQAGETPIGEGKTSCWYLGGIQPNSALTVFLNNADGNNDSNQKVNMKIFRTALFSSSLLSNTQTTESGGESTPSTNNMLESCKLNRQSDTLISKPQLFFWPDMHHTKPQFSKFLK